jgi:hypothetical protein
MRMSGEVQRSAPYPRLGLRIAPLLLVVVAACGGGGGGDNKPSATPKASATAAPAATAVNRDPIQIEARVADKRSLQFSDEVEAKAGDYVQVRALVRTKPEVEARNLVISIARRGAGDLKLRARSPKGKPDSTAVVRGASGKSLRLTQLRYSCFAPPARTFCPLKSVRVTPSDYFVRAKVSRTAPVVLTFTARSR